MQMMSSQFTGFRYEEPVAPVICLRDVARSCFRKRATGNAPETQGLASAAAKGFPR